MSISHVAALTVVAAAVAACHRYDYRPPLCPPVEPTHPVRVVMSPEHRGSVRGVVSSQLTGEAPGSALVSLLPRGAPDTSDAAGAFRFDSVAAGRYTLVTRRIGYEARRDTVSVPGGAWPRLEVLLHRDARGARRHRWPRHHTLGTRTVERGFAENLMLKSYGAD